MPSQQWYNDHFEAVYSYIFMQVKNPQLAEDLTQETFVKVVERAHQFRGESAVRTWIFRIAYTTTMSHFRRKNPLAYLLHTNTQLLSHHPSSEEIVLLQAQEKVFYQALQGLKLPYQQVIILRKIQDFSTKEVASILQWSEGKVKMTLLRALKAFKKELEKGGMTGESLVRR